MYSSENCRLPRIGEDGTRNYKVRIFEGYKDTYYPPTELGSYKLIKINELQINTIFVI